MNITITVTRSSCIRTISPRSQFDDFCEARMDVRKKWIAYLNDQLETEVINDEEKLNRRAYLDDLELIHQDVSAELCFLAYEVDLDNLDLTFDCSDDAMKSVEREDIEGEFFGLVEQYSELFFVPALSELYLGDVALQPEFMEFHMAISLVYKGSLDGRHHDYATVGRILKKQAVTSTDFVCQ